jgi:hypothetical protein
MARKSSKSKTKVSGSIPESGSHKISNLSESEMNLPPFCHQIRLNKSNLVVLRFTYFLTNLVFTT